MAILAIGSLVPYGGPVLRSEILTNDITTVVSDSVKIASGFVALGTAGKSVFGHVVGISTDKGVGVNTTGVAGAEMGSFVGTFLTATNNQTVGKVRANCDISQFTLYSAEVSAAIGTNDSDLLGNKMDLTDEDTLDESSTVTGAAQYNQWGVVPSDTTKALVNIFESQVFTDSQV